MFGFEVVPKIHAHYGVFMCWSWWISASSMRPLHPIYGHSQIASLKTFPRSLTVYSNSSVTTTNQTLLGAVCPKLKGRRKWWCGHATMFDEWSIYAKVRLKSTFRIFKARVWLSPWYLIGSQNTWTMFRIHEKCSKSYSHLSSDKSLTLLTFDIWISK